jgi:hypothetical protein
MSPPLGSSLLLPTVAAIAGGGYGFDADEALGPQQLMPAWDREFKMDD